MSSPGRRSATVSFAASLLAASLLAPAVFAAETVRITGLVADAGGPIEGALIRILEPHEEPDGWVVSREWRRTRSGADGRFEIEAPRVALEPWLRGEIWSSIDAQWSLEIRQPKHAIDLRQLIELRAHHTKVDLGAIVLGPGWTLEGQVVAATDERSPLAGARVMVWPRGLDRAIETLSAANGGFALRGLPDTEMTLAVAHADYSPCIREPHDLSGLRTGLAKLGGEPPPQLEPCVRERLTGGEPGSTVRLERPIELHPRLLLRGRVVDSASKPLAGVSVRAAVVPPAGAPRDWLGNAEATTWLHGLFSIRVGRREVQTMLEFRHPGYTTRRFYTKLASAPADVGRPWTAVGVQLEAGQPIRGRATLASGARAFDARVELHAAGEGGPVLRAQPTEKGEFDLGSWEPGSYRVVAHAPGLESVAATVEVGSDSTSPERLTLVLLPAERFDLTVQVRDASEAPIAGALVTTSPRSLECETDSRGQCTLRDLARTAEMLTLGVQHDGFLPARPSLEPPVDSIVEVRLEPLWYEHVDIAGSVRDEEGRAVAGALVTIGDPTEHAPPTPNARSGLDGGFVLERVPQGAYWMTVEASGYARHTTRFKAAPDAEPLAIELVGGATIHGEVLDLPPDVKSHGPVRARGHDPREEWEPGLVRWNFRGYPIPSFKGTLEGSAYRIEGVEPGFYVVSLATEGGVYGATVEVLEGVDDLRLDLPLAYTERKETSEEVVITGRVVEAESGLPIAGAELEIWHYKTTSAADGSFRFESLPTAELTPVAVTARGYADLTRRVARDERSAPLLLELRPAADLRYRVLWSDGEPVEWHQLELFDSSGQKLQTSNFPDGEPWEGLPAGDHTLRVDIGFAEQRVPVTLPGPEVVVVFEPAGSLRLRVPDLELEYGESGWLDGVTTVLTPISTVRPSQPLIFESELWLSGIPPGLWNVLVQDRRGRSWTKQVEVTARQSRTVLLD